MTGHSCRSKRELLAKRDPSVYWKYIDYIRAHYNKRGAHRIHLANTFKKLDDLALLCGSAREVGSSELRNCIAD